MHKTEPLCLRPIELIASESVFFMFYKILFKSDKNINNVLSFTKLLSGFLFCGNSGFDFRKGAFKSF